MTLSSSPRSSDRPDPRVLRCVRQAALAGVALVLVWPAARGHSEWVGWLPLWLVGMPLAAWWSLRGFPLPQMAMARMPRRRRAQALRRGRSRRAMPLRHAA